MQSKKIVGLGLLALSAGVIACAPRHTVLAPPLDTPAPVAHDESFLPRPGHAIVSFSIRWPQAISTQSIPGDTRRLVIAIMAGDKQVDSKTVERGANPTEKVSFDLNPALGVISVTVQALRGDGTVLARGVTTVALRDNSVARASVTLTVEDEVLLSNEKAVAFLNAPQNVFSNWQGYESDPDMQALKAAMETVLKFAPNLGSPNLAVALKGARRVDLPEEFLRFVSGPGAVDLVDSEFANLYWPGYTAKMSVIPGATGRAFQVELAPGGKIAADASQPVDASTGMARLEVDANEWQDEPFLALEGRFLAPNHQEATRSVMMFGGKIPATNRITRVKAIADFVPNAVLERKVALNAEASAFADMKANPLFQQFFPNPTWTSVPTLVTGAFQSPDLTIKNLRASLRPDLTGGAVKGDLAVSGVQGVHDMSVDVVGNWIFAPSPYGYGMLLRKLDSDFTLVDRNLNMRASGFLGLEANAAGSMTQTLKVNFYNHVTNRLLGSIDYKALPGQDMARLANWPLLKLYANDANPTQATEIRLTPGYFAGNQQADGTLTIGVY